MGLRATVIAALAGALVLQPAWAGWRDVVPRPVKNGAWLDLYGSFERNESRYDGPASVWRDTFLKEKITFYSTGYVYHPRFLTYDMSLGSALKQEKYEATFLPGNEWTSTSGVEYDGRLTFLPEHPYNLELFARRYEPLYKEQSATQRDNVERSRGVALRYRKKPYFFDARFTDDTVESDIYRSDVRRFNTSGEYSKRFRSGRQFSLSAAHESTDFGTSTGLDGNTAENSLGGVVDLQNIKLSTSVLRNTFEQEGAVSGRFENDQFAFYETLTAYLPAGFRTDLSYRIHDNDSTLPTGSGGSNKLSDYSEDYQLDIVHRLYRSLDTSYRYLRVDRSVSGSDSLAESQFLSMNYTKEIPRGRLMAGANVGRSDVTNEGQVDVTNEPHPTAVPGSFTLVQQDIDRPTIAIYLRSPISPFQVILLVENVHYTVTPIANQYSINVLMVPAVAFVPPPFVYDIFASYSLLTGDFELVTDSRGCNASVELLDHRLTPYYSYAAVRTKEEAGAFPGTPLDSTTHTAGVIFYNGPWRARGEYQSLDWDVSPYRSWRGEVQANGTLGRIGRGHATVSYLDKEFPEGTTAQPNEGYSETTTSISAGLQKQLAPRNLTFAAGGSWSRLEGLVDTVAHSINASMSWRIGKIDVSLGANAYRSDTEGTTAGSILREDEYYYLRIRRELF